MAQHGRYVGDLVTALLTAADPAAEAFECIPEEQLDVVGLEAAGPRFPLAGRAEDTAEAVYFPVGMPTFYAPFLSPLWVKGTSLGRDGLALDALEPLIGLDPDVERRGEQLSLFATADV